MSKEVDRQDDAEGTKKPRPDGCVVRAGDVQAQSEEANRDVEKLSGYLVLVDEVAVVTVERYQAQRRWRPRELPPGLLDSIVR